MNVWDWITRNKTMSLIPVNPYAKIWHLLDMIYSFFIKSLFWTLEIHTRQWRRQRFTWGQGLQCRHCWWRWGCIRPKFIVHHPDVNGWIRRWRHQRRVKVSNITCSRFSIHCQSIEWVGRVCHFLTGHHQVKEAETRGTGIDVWYGAVNIKENIFLSAVRVKPSYFPIFMAINSYSKSKNNPLS